MLFSIYHYIVHAFCPSNGEIRSAVGITIEFTHLGVNPMV